jgi:3-oxoadipate enol-lactonase
MGGMVAQELALRAPARVDRLVLVSTSADCHPVIDAHRRRFAATLEGMTSGASFWRHVLPVPFSRHFLEHEWERLPELFGSGADLALDGIAAQLDAVGRHDTRARLGGIHAPTLVIGGGDDRLVPSECSTELARLIEGAQLRIVAGASHCLNIERADEFNDSVLAFLGNTPCERRASDVRDPG